MENLRKAICLWCNEEFAYPEGDTDALQVARRRMLAHDVACQNNPNVQLISKLEIENAQLRNRIRELKQEGGAQNER